MAETSSMTGVTDEPEVITARRTESLDAPHIMKLVQPWTETLFGRVNVVNIIEKAVLAITLVNKHDRIMSNAEFLDYPNIPEVDQASWEDWFAKNYNSSQVTPLNTLFLHYFVSLADYAIGSGIEIIRTAFNAVPDLHFIFLAVPVGTYPDPCLAQVFRPMERLENVDEGVSSVLFVCRRHEHVPVLHIREAYVEDHDDLTPIFNRQSEMLHNTYGDYYLAELIEAQDANMQCLVSEVEKTSYGFMSISSDVNLELLNECFELVPFHGLRKPHSMDVLYPPVVLSEPSASVFEQTPETEAKIESVPEKVTTPEKQPSLERASAEEAPVESSHFDSGTFTSSSDDSGRTPAVKLSRRLSELGSNTKAILEAESEFLNTVQDAALNHGPGTPGYIYYNHTNLYLKEEEPFIPQFYGAPNAFAIQLFCIAEQYEMRSCDFLPKAFLRFPEREYCIITVPHMVPEFPLLQNFVRVTPKNPSILPQELYVFHRSGLLKNLNVRIEVSDDIPEIEKLVDTISMKEFILKDLHQFNDYRRDDRGCRIQAFVAECFDQIVGVCVLRQEEDVEYIRSHYNIEDFIYFNHHRREDHGRLNHFIMNPVFNHLTKHFFKEILRLSHKSCLYYPLFPPYTPKEEIRHHTLISGLNALVPVRARRQIIYPIEQLGVNGPSERISKELPPFALNHINRKLVLEPKVTVNARIIVVGASDVGIAFLETLVFCPHLRFNNLTLVSPHGLPGDMVSSELQEKVLASSHNYTTADYGRMSLRTWVNVVYGKLTALDRANKQIVINNKSVVPFDHLVMTVGSSYQTPNPSLADLSENATNENLPKSPKARFFGNKPRNLLLVHDNFDAAVLLYKIQHGIIPLNKKVVIYGDKLDMFTCAQALIELGMPSSNIVIVEVPLDENISCFNNPVVEDCVYAAISEAGITLHRQCFLAYWNDNEQAESGIDITSVSFTSPRGAVKIECGALIAFYMKDFDLDGFISLNSACIVYDGKLTIDTTFHTNDVSIRGAGTCTKFGRKYYCDGWSHARFNSKEVGIALASDMLRLFDPTLEPLTEPEEETLNLIPIYRSPKVTCAYLPGGYHYLHIYKPNLTEPLQQQMAQADYGECFVTGSPSEEKGYFRIHVNQYKNVETITCLSKKPIPVDNLLCLYGVHEKMLNNMVGRYKEELIDDFYSYFQEPWCMAIYHDRFPDFRDEIRELLINNPKDGEGTIEDLARQLLDEETGLTEEQSKDIMNAYIATGAKRAVETRLLNFLSYNQYHLPMYARPGMI